MARGRVMLLFLAPDDAIGDAIDMSTGGNGFSHVVIDDGSGVVLDCYPGRGVHVSPLATYRNRIRATYTLGDAYGKRVVDCARAKVGAGYQWCAQFVSECLGLGGTIVSPNALARELGVV